MRQLRGAARLVLVTAASSVLLAACGGGGGSGGSEGRLQAIDFSYPGGSTVTDGPVMLKATATSGLPVSFRSGTPSTCTVSGDQLTLVGKGECLVIASQAGGVGADGAQWAAADETSQLFNVLGGPQAIVPPAGIVLRASTLSVALPATTEAGLPATYVSSSPSVCTVSGTTLTALSHGVCQLTITAPGDATYAELAVQAFLPVDTIPPFVVVTQGKPQTVALDGADADGNALSYTSSTPAVCGVTGGELRLLAKGRCSVTVSGGAASEELFVSVDPRYYATGFNMALNRTAEFGEINFGAGVPIASWCGGATPSWCKLGVTQFSSTFAFDVTPAAQPGWTGSTDGWWSYYFYEIGAPRKQVVGGGSPTYEWQPFDVKTEESLFFGLGMNATQFAGGGDVFVRIRTNHLAKLANGSDCYVTVSAHLHPKSADPTGYLVPLSEFAVTNKCEIADLPQTEGWMFDWGVSAESKAAALAEIRAHGIRSLEFGPGSMNLSRPTPRADGSLPGPNDADYSLNTSLTVYGPITVQ